MSALWAVQQAIYAKLANDAGVKALIGDPARLYDDVPASAVFPHVVLGETSGGPWDSKSFHGIDESLTLHVWSRGIEARGKKQAKQILDAIHAALHDQSLTVTGRTAVIVRLEFVEVFQDPDGLTSHGVARYQVVTHS